MIVLSFLLVVFAAVTLLIGLFQDTLTWIWMSIGACVLAMVFLGIGVLQRRSSRRESDEAEGEAYGPGAISGLISSDEEEREEAAVASEDVSVVPKRSVSDARGEISRAEVEEAADEAVAEAEAKAKKKTAKKDREEEGREEEVCSQEDDGQGGPRAARSDQGSRAGEAEGAARRVRLARSDPGCRHRRSAAGEGHRRDDGATGPEEPVLIKEDLLIKKAPA